ncbi:MAG: DnaJ domain-containing protein [Alphaproteobacteria bacterium]
MVWVFIGAIVLIGVLLLANWAAKADKASVRQIARYFGAFLIAAAAILLASRGAFSIAGILAVLAVLLASRRVLPFLGGASRSAGQNSQVETRYLRVTLDHDSGAIDGVIREGGYAGKRLSDLDRVQLTDLYELFKVEDQEGARLLDAYMARRFAGEWEEETSSDTVYDSGHMTPKEAREILGVRSGASADEIKTAHRNLMKKFHPDQGGSTYFAARLNEAKDLLLGL